MVLTADISNKHFIALLKSVVELSFSFNCRTTFHMEFTEVVSSNSCITFFKSVVELSFSINSIISFRLVLPTVVSSSHCIDLFKSFVELSFLLDIKNFHFSRACNSFVCKLYGIARCRLLRFNSYQREQFGCATSFLPNFACRSIHMWACMVSWIMGSVGKCII